MFDFIYGTSEYPLTAQYLERNAPLTIDDSTTFEGAVPFSYRKIKSGSREEQIINGLKQISYALTIRTKDKLEFKAKDIIIIDNKNYKIKSADKVENDLYKNSRIIYKHFVDYETEIVLE